MKRFVASCCFLLALFVVNGCGGGDGQSPVVEPDTISPNEIDPSEVFCSVRNTNLFLPGGTTCRGLSVFPMDFITPGAYWRCEFLGMHLLNYQFFQDGTATATFPDGDRYGLRWVVDSENCSLRTRSDSCGNTWQNEIVNVSDDSLTLVFTLSQLQLFDDEGTLSQYPSSTLQERQSLVCHRRQGVLSSDLVRAGIYEGGEIADDDDNRGLAEKVTKLLQESVGIEPDE